MSDSPPVQAGASRCSRSRSRPPPRADDVTLDTSAANGAISVASVDGTTAGAQSLTVKSGSGHVTLGNAGATNAMSNVANLGVIQRPDGTKQVTENGKALYTFTLDSAGTTKGDNFSDDFTGQHFTWHAVRATGATAAPPATTPSGGDTGITSPSTTTPSAAGGG